ncbi:MAG: hypothetical protein ACAI44_36190 [Candidatus Sericytochromatia bacterium]
MNNHSSQIEALIHILQTGTPNAAYQAGKELMGFGHAAEEPLSRLLGESKDALKVRHILNILEEVKVSKPGSVETVVRLLRHDQNFVRGSAAQCLLRSSPKLRPFIGQIQAALKQEKDTNVRQILQKLLDRYPKDA